MQQWQRLSYLQPGEWAGLIEIMVYIVNTWKISTLEEKLKKSEIIFISKTPILPSGYRGEEIKLMDRQLGGESVESFVIINDDADI
ncbi:hypothetical protein [Lacrimispora sp.]|uniref:hypothetical protein n=1 Tax=Lacrimispora sp. TaxID=2719234 RepID=UPI0028A751EE|nr:hypothetical protein [Lacrimispora sp.]